MQGEPISTDLHRHAYSYLTNINIVRVYWKLLARQQYRPAGSVAGGTTGPRAVHVAACVRDVVF